jgi:hypothetical protein
VRNGIIVEPLKMAIEALEMVSAMSTYPEGFPMEIVAHIESALLLNALAKFSPPEK